jgi:hypothetical protein
MENERRANHCCPTPYCSGILYVEGDGENNTVRCTSCTFHIKSQREEDCMLKTAKQMKEEIW